MQLDNEYVVAHSLSFDERIALLRAGGASVSAGSADADAVVARRLEVLRRRLTLSDGRTMLMSRLSGRNVPWSLAAAACSPEFRVDGPEPNWLRWFLLGAENLSAGQISRSDGALPFDDLLGAFEESALVCIAESDDRGRWRDLSKPAKRSATEWLRLRLSRVLQWCFFSAFDRFRRQRGRLPGSYEAFVDSAASPEWVANFFSRYAGVARLVASVIVDWSNNVLVLLGRFAHDRLAILRQMGVGTEATIDRFERFPSDAHAGGQSVAIILLSTGDRLVYKPTDQRLAALWGHATDLCFGDSHRAPPLLRAGYAWHAFVDEDVDVDVDATAFSLGRALALATALGSTDMHFENFVPTNTGLVLVDHETVLSPRVDARRTSWTRAHRRAFGDIADSVLVTGALPRWSVGPDGALWNADAFGWQLETDSPVFPFLVDANTDQMRVSTDAAQRQRTEPFSSPPALDRRSVDGQVVADGFQDGWSRVHDVREKLAALVRDSAPVTVRVVMRATREYSELLGHSYMPPYCHDVLDRSLLFERLRRALDGVPVTDGRWDVVDDELEALIRGDVPLFWTDGSRLALREAAGKRMPVTVRGTAPVPHALQCLRGLGRQRRVRNDELITSALEAAEWPAVTVRYGRASPSTRVHDGWSGRYAAAVRLFDAVRRRAYTSSIDGSIATVAATLDASGRAQQLGVADPADTYSGIAGLGLLASALDAVRPEHRYRDTAKRVADTLSVALDALAGAGQPARAGAFSGPTGVAYVLHVIGDLLGEGSFSVLARASLATWARTSGELSSDTDVVSGAAGGCMVALALAEPDSPGPELAAFAASRVGLLRAVAMVEGSTCAWPQVGATQKSGFAHGSAGIAVALARAVVNRN